MSEGGHLDAKQDGVPTSDEARGLASNQTNMMRSKEVGASTVIKAGHVDVEGRGS
jgi:hypothetical protein